MSNKEIFLIGIIVLMALRICFQSIKIVRRIFSAILIIIGALCLMDLGIFLIWGE